MGVSFSFITGWIGLCAAKLHSQHTEYARLGRAVGAKAGRRQNSHVPRILASEVLKDIQANYLRLVN